MTWLFPVIACLFYKQQKRNPNTSDLLPAELAVLIPAHNEERHLPTTLASIQRAVQLARKHFPTLRIVISVAADGCTDRTAVIAREMGAEVIEHEQSKGKWHTLQALVRHNRKSDWVILADAGVAWPETLLSELFPYCLDADTIGIAPTYHNAHAGILEKLAWMLERHLKNIESLCGGPVSVHGATVAYRTDKLLPAIDKLVHGEWLNDDVVLPLLMRALYPNGTIRYMPHIAVQEQAANEIPVVQEYTRRKRMAVGNVQWVRARLWQGDLVVGTLAMRRVCRMLWAYWCMMCGVAVISVIQWNLPAEASIIALLCATALCCVRPARRLARTAGASLMVPYYFFFPPAKLLWK